VISQELLQALSMFAFVSFGQWVGWRLAITAAIYYESRILNDLANYCFQYLHKHTFAFFNDNFVGSLVKKVGRFCRSFEDINDKIIFNVLNLLLNTTIIVFILSFRNIILGMVMLVWVIVFVGINIIVAKYKLKYDVARSEADTKTGAHLADTITNNVNIKLFVGFQNEVQIHKDLQNDLLKKRLKTWNISNFFEAIQGILGILLEVGLFYVAIKLWNQGRLTVGDFALIQSYIVVILSKVWDFGNVVRRIYESLADAQEMTEILIKPHDIIDIPKAKDLHVSEGVINFKDVVFNYHETRSILKKFNLTIKSGEKVALIGPSGAGKSTIVKLLLRMHDVTGGKISIDGQNIARIKQESLWKNISLVPQDPILFHRTLRENIRYGRIGASDENVEEAAKSAHCHEFISDLEKGYETFVGERGVKLSGGERQRVAIARAILKNAPILLLDEATSSLDSESEHFIQDALNNLMKGKTVIMIAHRLSTIMSADRILVIDHGEVVEDGNHKELLKIKGGLYKKLWDLQAGGFIK
jgi:ATP-binding cassette subfamily B protein